ncbi:MAG: calcium/sodium antiporter [Thermodesulfobacteriota bacterium]|nr:calcium/sodium antiporter [Thermodesulfobacteriota bacterium]
MAAVTSLAVIIFAIYLLIIISNDFFIESLDRISEKLRLSPSVAGATLMAMGSSAPELSIALIALFTHGGAHSDMGIGTIVGSAVFNILVITGLCAVIRTAAVTLGAIIRDTAFYVASILIMVYIFADGAVTPAEPFFLIALYGAYLLALFLYPGDEFQEPAPHPPVIPDNNGSSGPLKLFNRWIKHVVTIVAGDAHKNYLRAFAVSILIIVIISKVLVDNAIIFANAIHLPPVIVALTILAAGTSAPDLISSIIVAKQGRGDMAIANAVGSNIFDILIGLGLPWLIILYATSRDIIPVGTKDLMESVFILIGTVMVLFFFLCTQRQLGKKEGIVLLLIYAGYIAWTVLN